VHTTPQVHRSLFASAAGGDDVLAALAGFFTDRAPLDPGDGVVVAFSGGPDSTALLWGLARLAERRGFALAAAHLDHGLDAGSAERARAAARLAAEVGVPLTVERRPVPALAGRGDGPEAAARRVRYAFLDEVRRRRGARYLATAHHRDDQAETVLLRLLRGSGLAGLGAIRPLAPAGDGGSLVRPLLALPRSTLAAAVAAAGLNPVDDPTNADLARPRNFLRHRLLPALAASEPDLVEFTLAERAASLATAAQGALTALDARLDVLLAPRPVAGGLAVPAATLRALPAPLLPFALALLHRRAGVPYPASRAARGELERQLAGGTPVACDCGGGWCWSERDGRLALDRRRAAAPPFTYTLTVPGELEIPELALRFRLVRGPVRPWMFRGSPRRAGLALPLAPGGSVTVRSRRPGDRLRPLGAPGRRRLKEVLIDHRVPRRERDRLPLLCLGADGGTIAWVPGVTVDDDFRLAGDAAAWVAEVEPR
jgi:tRNA(Ile)-lysidine synthase